MTGEDYFLCYVRQHPDDLWMDAETTIRNYPFSDCEDDVFYIKDETVYLLFPKYALRAGAMGPVEIPVELPQ